MRPDLKWIVLKGQVAGSASGTFGPEVLPHPFKPLAFQYKSTGRAIGGLYAQDEPFFNQKADLDAQFGQAGDQVIVPPEAQLIYPAHREFKLDVTDLSTATNDICLAIMGLQFTGLKDIPPTRGLKLKWLNLYKNNVGANATEHLTGTLSFPFKPLAIFFKSTGRADCVLEIDRKPFANQAGDLDALFGTLGKAVMIPEEAQKVYGAKVTFDAVVSDTSGSNNIVSVSLLGVQYGD